jgi:hypothetical protein
MIGFWIELASAEMGKTCGVGTKIGSSALIMLMVRSLPFIRAWVSGRLYAHWSSGKRFELEKKCGSH